MRLVAKGNECTMKLEDKTTGELFAKSPIEQYPGIAIEAVNDSSRYFVVRIQDDDGNKLIFQMLRILSVFFPLYLWLLTHFRTCCFYWTWFLRSV